MVRIVWINRFDVVNPLPGLIGITRCNRWCAIEIKNGAAFVLDPAAFRNQASWLEYL
jgi:hypothetical protein